MEPIIQSDGEGNGTPLQHSCLENPMDGEGWWAAVHGVAKSRTRLSKFTFTFHCIQDLCTTFRSFSYTNHFENKIQSYL